MPHTESTETIIARIDERQKANNEMTHELLRIVKGDNGEGLTTRIAKIEQTQGNCPQVQSARDSIKWLTWGFRMIVGAIIGACIWLVKG